MTTEPDQNPDRTENNPAQKVSPREAARYFIENRKEEVREDTIRGNRPALKRFATWCEEHDKDLTQLTGLDIQQYYDDLRNDDTDYAKTTLRNYMGVVRLFLRFLERLDVAPDDISEKVHTPTLEKTDRVRNTEIDPERVQQIVDWLDTYDYAGRDHIIMLLLWRCGMRIGGLHSLDVEDVQELEGDPVLNLRHRPETGTKLKNGVDGERPVNLAQHTVQAVQDYIEHKRIDREDEYGRNPLITTENGRIDKSVIRAICYKWTCPQYTGVGTCSCDGRPNQDEAKNCEASVSPHVIRSASITYWRSRDVPVDIVSDRKDVSPDVIEQHYDRRTKEGKAVQRRKYLDNVD